MSVPGAALVPQGAGATKPATERSHNRSHVPSTHRHAAALLARDAVEIRRARSLVRSSLESWGLAAQIPALELAVSELVTNAITHGTGDVEVQLTADADVVRLAVADHGGKQTPHIDRRADAGGTGGWGLQLVDQLSDAWGTNGGPNRTRVWLERRTDRSDSV